MSVLDQQRAFLKAYHAAGGNLAATLKAADVAEGLHLIWMRDANYRGAFDLITKESAGGAIAPKRRGRPRVHPLPAPDAPKRPRGRPPRNLAPPPAAVAVDSGIVREPSHGTASNEGEKCEVPPAAAPPAEAPAGTYAHTIEGDKGYVRLFVPEGAPVPVDVPPAPEPKPPKLTEPEAPALDVSLASDAEQRAMIDEYGELDRRMQLRAADVARYEVLKRAIKSWFGDVPADADGTVEGEVYLLHLSARERERTVADLRAVVDLIGFERFLQIATVPITALENILGKSHVAGLVTEARSGSRRIKAIPKHPAQLNGDSPHA